MNKRNIIFGLILICLGILLLGRAFNLFYFTIGDFFENMVPLGFIILGVWLIVRKKKQQDKFENMSNTFTSSGTSGQSYYKSAFSSSSAGQTKFEDSNSFSQARTGFTGDYKYDTSAGPASEENGVLKYSKFLGDLFIDFGGVKLSNAEVSAGISDIDIKLNGVILGKGLNRLIISGFIGDIKIFVPGTIEVFISSSNFIGDIDLAGRATSGFGNNLETQTTNYDASGEKLYIAINTFVGDIRVYKI